MKYLTKQAKKNRPRKRGRRHPVQAKRNDPDELKERAITLLTETGGTPRPSNYSVTFSFMIYPSTFYDKITHMREKETFQHLSKYQVVLNRIKALIEKQF